MLLWSCVHMHDISFIYVEFCSLPLMQHKYMSSDNNTEVWQTQILGNLTYVYLKTSLQLGDVFCKTLDTTLRYLSFVCGLLIRCVGLAFNNESSGYRNSPNALLYAS